MADNDKQKNAKGTQRNMERGMRQKSRRRTSGEDVKIMIELENGPMNVLLIVLEIVLETELEDELEIELENEL